MLIYRFKITSENHEGFLREILIQPSQTFLDFHYGLMEASELIPCEQASFFLLDRKFKKTREISLNLVEKILRKYDPDLDEMVPVKISSKLMKDTRIKDTISDPHQMFVYEYHGKDDFVLLIELVKILQMESGIFPQCTRQEGELPKKKEFYDVDEKEPENKKAPTGKKGDLLDSELQKLEGIEEDEAAIAAIENDLEDFLFGGDKKDKPEKKKGKKASKDREDEGDADEALFDEEDSDDEEDDSDLEDENSDEDADEDDSIIESIEDFDNIEDLEAKYRRLNEDPDE